VLRRGDQRLAFEDAAEQVDLSRRPVGKIGKGAFDDFLIQARGLAEEHRRGGVAVGDDVDIHGLFRST
jgi:hypothetical protein